MPEITLTADTGRPIGSRASNRLRHSGKIPGVLYGHGNEPIPIAVDARSLRAALSGEAGLNALLNLELDGRSQLAMAKDIQRDPVRGTVSHVDFLAVNRDEIITADVPIVLVGEAIAVNRGDGHIDQQLHTLTIHAKPGDLPNQVEVDISDMEIGDAIRVDDLSLPAGATTDQDGETTLVVAQPPQVEAPAEGEEAEAAAAAEGAPEAAAEAGEGGGEAPAAESDSGAASDEG
jgi:large subunit ribosomal protein L25